MKRTKNKATSARMPQARAMSIASALVAGDTSPAIQFLAENSARASVNGTWENAVNKLLKLAAALASGEPIESSPFSVFAKGGNIKLPFAAFSSLPIIDCAGYGACGEWCYSLTAWRYANAWARQAANSMLLRHESGRTFIAREFAKIGTRWSSKRKPISERKAGGILKLSENKPKITLRLYVDGDFHSKESLKWWMELIATRGEVSVYGYSKSWVEFLALHLDGYAWPENYTLNLSGGSRHEGTHMLALMERLPVTRGEFIAVPIPATHIRNKAYQSKRNSGHAEYARDVRAAAGKRVFVCPGRCGDCLPDGSHACGNYRMLGVTIAIGVH
jgi:hypothetical protein